MLLHSSQLPAAMRKSHLPALKQNSAEQNQLIWKMLALVASSGATQLKMLLGAFQLLGASQTQDQEPSKCC